MVCNGDYFGVKPQLAVIAEPLSDEVDEHFMLRINSNLLAGVFGKVNAVALSSNRNGDAFIDFCLSIKPVTDASFAQQINGALFQNASANGAFYLFAALLFDDNRFHAFQMEQMREHESCRTSTDDGYWSV